MEATLTARLADYRNLRREIERNVLPLATSVDGRTFEFQAPLEPLEIRVGGYVTLDGRLGQILSLEVARMDAGELGWTGEASFSSRVTIRFAQGAGTLLDGGETPFHDAEMRPAAPEAVAAWLRASAPRRARLQAGELRLADGVTHGLDAGGFDRHTFLCGQSGSGKTYALGVLLERILLSTQLRVVVLDPNSDFVPLATPRADADPELAERYREATASLVVQRAGAHGEPDRLRLRIGELAPAAQAAALRLDPVRDRDEYATFTELLAGERLRELRDLAELDRPGAAELAARALNLGVAGWGIWARQDPGSSLELLGDTSVRGVVIDLGSLATREEQALVAGAVLERLWRDRARREPVLIVIDEAHNVCPAEPEDALTALATEHAVRIAAEGRKFGLYLLTSTQRPQKVHPNVVSQCDNLVLMRMNSAADLAHAAEMFSFVPAGLLTQAASFRLGEALVAGKLSSHPALLRVGARISAEGGGDVPASWAQ